jgi:hypothetical protein
MAAIYARVSSEQQREENTIASQTAALIEFAQSHDLEVRLPFVTAFRFRCNACLQFSSSQTSSISRSVPARLSDLRFARSVSIHCSAAFGASLLLSAGKASTSCSGRLFCRCPLMSRAAYLPFPLFPLRGTVRAFGSSFPARPICFSAFRLWSASLALPTA